MEARLATSYGYGGADQRVVKALVAPEQIRQRIQAFEDVGREKIFISSCSAEPEQVDRLVDEIGI